MRALPGNAAMSVASSRKPAEARPAKVGAGFTFDMNGADGRDAEFKRAS